MNGSLKANKIVLPPMS